MKRWSRGGKEKAVVPESIFGVPLYPHSMRSMEKWCVERIRKRRRGYVCVSNVHVVTESVLNMALRRALRHAAAVVPDGMPLVWYLRGRGHHGQKRLYGPDLTLRLVALCRKHGFRVGLFGSEPGTIGAMATVLRRRFPGVRIAGRASPPYRRSFTSSDIRAHARIINRWRPDLLFVGLGAPKQEVWMYRARSLVRAPVMAGVGAAFDFIAGTKPQAPRWMMRSGLEWSFRLVTEPGRLWRRYVVFNTLFVIFMILQSVGIIRNAARTRT